MTQGWFFVLKYAFSAIEINGGFPFLECLFLYCDIIAIFAFALSYDTQHFSINLIVQSSLLDLLVILQPY